MIDEWHDDLISIHDLRPTASRTQTEKPPRQTKREGGTHEP